MEVISRWLPSRSDAVKAKNSAATCLFSLELHMGDAMKPGADTSPLEDLGMLSASQVESLRKRWIKSVEALAGVAASDSGREGLAVLLEMTKEQIAALLQKASEVLGPQRYQEITAARPGGPTGALFTDEQKRQFGM
jgi:hypothetical protein